MSDEWREIDEALARARGPALELLKQFANDPNPRVAAEAQRILRRYGEHLSPIVEQYADAQRRRRDRERRNDPS